MFLERRLKMALTPPKGKAFELPPEGPISGVCTRVIDTGTHYNEKFKKNIHQVSIGFELDELMEDGRPFFISKRYTYSLHEKSKLRPALESWRGKAYSEEELNNVNLLKLLNNPACLNIVHENGYANIMPLLEGMKIPKASSECIGFEIENFNKDVFSKLPDSMKYRIRLSKEYLSMQENREKSDESPSEEDGDIPF